MKATPAQLAATAAALLGVAALTVGMARTKPVTKPPPPALLGAVISGVTRAMVCDPGYAKRVRHTTQAQKEEVLRLAGVPKASRGLYEVDHIVPLSAGGQDSVANLQAQPWDGPDGATKKDLVEAHCWRKVCSGDLTLEAAQSIFRTPGGWQRALKDFGLDRPRLRAMPGLDHDEEGFPR